jgi:hypothetical protein
MPSILTGSKQQTKGFKNQSQFVVILSDQNHRECMTRAPFCCWICHPRDSVGGNVDAKGVVNIICVLTAKNQCWHSDWTYCGCSANSANNWIQLNYPVNFLVRWTFAGSIDGDWQTALDRPNTKTFEWGTVRRLVSTITRFDEREQARLPQATTV